MHLDASGTTRVLNLRQMLTLPGSKKKKCTKEKPLGLVQTSFKRTPFWESSFNSLDAEVTTSNCLSEDGAKQTWRAESTIDLSVVTILISTLRTFNRTTRVLEFNYACRRQFVNLL